MPIRFLSQRKIPWIGGFKETLSQVLWWGIPVNFIMLAATFYYTTMKEVWPWFHFSWFIGIIIISVIVIFYFEFRYIVPSIWDFRARQMSRLDEKLDNIIGRLERIEKGLDTHTLD